MGKQQVFIPAGITDISRGTRSDSVDHPRLESRSTRTPEGLQASPRVVVTVATRPGANFSDPSRIKKHGDKSESLKALD